MQDRVSLYPGRVKLVPVSGQENTYDMVRADSPTQEGTHLNKDSLLKDATAALYGLDKNAVPDDVLALIKPVLNSLSEGILNKAKIATGSYVGTGSYGASSPNSLTLEFEPKLLIVTGDDDSTGGSSYAYDYKIVAVNGTTKIVSEVYYQMNNASACTVSITWDGLTVNWFSTEGGYAQLNKSGAVYNYVAIG